MPSPCSRRPSGKQKLLPKSKGNPPPPPPTQLLALSHALAAPLYPLFKITGVEAMKGGWRRGGALFRKLSSVQFWQRRPRWTLGDRPLLPFLSVGVSPKGCSLPTCFHLATQPSKQTEHTSNTPRNRGTFSRGVFPFRAERETHTRAVNVALTTAKLGGAQPLCLVYPKAGTKTRKHPFNGGKFAPV